MASRKEASDKKKELSSQISTLIRTLSLSVLAVAWLFLSGNKDAPAIVQLVPKSHVMAIGALCVLAITLDLVQYIAGYIQVSGDYERAKSEKSEVVIYSDSKIRWFAFRGKIIFCMLAAFWLVTILFFSLGASSKNQAKKECDPHNVIIIKPV